MSSPYDTDVGTVHAALAEMQSNVGYMRCEQSGIYLPDAARASLKNVLDEFDGLIYDLRTEARNLEDKLGMHPGEPPNDPDIRNPDPRVTLGFLREWPREAFINMNAVVERLQAMGRDPAVGLAFTLVAESAANMLRANSEMLDALERIGAKMHPHESCSTDSNLDPNG